MVPPGKFTGPAMTSFRLFAVAGVALSGFGAEAAADAAADNDLKGRFTGSGNVAMVSDYRARGISVTDRDPTLQGGFDVSERSGFSAGVWASGIDGAAGSTTEIDLYAAKTFALGENELSIGATFFHYPGADDLDYGEASVGLSRTLGPVDTDLSVLYAWEQENTGNEDNLYVVLNGSAPVGRVADLPLTLSGSFGYEEGPLAVRGSKLDWTASLATEVKGTTMGVSYVDSTLSDDIGEATAVLSLSRTF